MPQVIYSEGQWQEHFGTGAIYCVQLLWWLLCQDVDGWDGLRKKDAFFNYETIWWTCYLHSGARLSVCGQLILRLKYKWREEIMGLSNRGAWNLLKILPLEEEIFWCDTFFYKTCQDIWPSITDRSWQLIDMESLTMNFVNGKMSKLKKQHSLTIISYSLNIMYYHCLKEDRLGISELFLYSILNNLWIVIANKIA